MAKYEIQVGNPTLFPAYVSDSLETDLLVRLEFEIKLEPLLFTCPPAAAALF